MPHDLTQEFRMIPGGLKRHAPVRCGQTNKSRESALCPSVGQAGDQRPETEVLADPAAVEERVEGAGGLGRRAVRGWHTHGCEHGAGVGGLVVPFIGIKAIDLLVTALHLV